MELIGPYLAACLLLVAAGVGKLRPRRGAAGEPGRRRRRAAAAAEVLLGACGLAVLDRGVAAAVALAYAGFAGYVVVERRRRGRLASCGCFGAEDTPVTRLHVALDLGLAAAAAAVGSGARTWPGAMTTVVGRQAWSGLPLALAAVLLAGLVRLALVRLPVTMAAARAVRGEVARWSEP